MSHPEHDASETRVTIGESAGGENAESAPSGLPPGEQDSPTVDDEPETQETG
jgi:hypothetical protein